ncbi:MAG: GspMb/PilO family protein [Planctomycetota bacterium]|jgi:hypothetical protein
MRANYKRDLATVAAAWAIFFVAACVVYVTVLAPQAEYKKQLEGELATKLATYESAKIAAQEKTRLSLNEQIKGLRERLKNFVVECEDSTNLTFYVSEIAGQKEVASFSINRREDRLKSEMPDCKHICEEHMNVRFNAEFNQFCALLNALERRRPVVFVDDFTITRSKSGELYHPVNMELAVFVMKPEDGGTAGAI